MSRKLLPLILLSGSVLLAGCQTSSVGPTTSTTPSANESGSPIASTGHAAGEPTDAEIETEIEAKGCLLSPDLGTHAGCTSVDQYQYSAITRHGLVCYYPSRTGQLSYPITMEVMATGHYQDGDFPVSVVADGSAAHPALMFYYSATDGAWQYNSAALSVATTPDASRHCPRV